MRIVDHRTFLALPCGTLFTKCDNGALHIPEFKQESIQAPPGDERTFIDFYSLSIVPPLNLDTDGLQTVLSDAEAGDGVLDEIIESPGRDGCFDWDQKYLVWDQKDLHGLMCNLTDSMEDPDLLVDIIEKANAALALVFPSERDNLTKEQRMRWVGLQVDMPGVEIEHCAGAIGYWSRNAGYPRPREAGEERDGWLEADADIKEDGEQPVQMLKRLIGQIRSASVLQAVFTEVESRMLGLQSSFHPGDKVHVVHKLYTGPGTVATCDGEINTDQVPVQLSYDEPAAEIFRRTHGSGLWIFQVGDLTKIPKTLEERMVEYEARLRRASPSLSDELVAARLQGYRSVQATLPPHTQDASGLVKDPKGKPCGLLIPVHGSVRATCDQCGKAIVLTKAPGVWQHVAGDYMHQAGPASGTDTAQQ